MKKLRERPWECKAVLGRLRDGLMRQVRLNAHLDYQVDPSLPPPEVFERPGWKVLWAEEGACEIIMPAYRPLRCLDDASSDPSLHIPVEKIRVRPAIEFEARFHFAPGLTFWLGLGFSVPSRTYVVFHSSTPTPQEGS